LPCLCLQSVLPKQAKASKKAEQTVRDASLAAKIKISKGSASARVLKPDGKDTQASPAWAKGLKHYHTKGWSNLCAMLISFFTKRIHLRCASNAINTTKAN
jgi:hypothetical protein